MPAVLPLQAVLANAKSLNKIIAPPYDVVSRAQARAYTQDNAQHFLNVTRPEGLLDDTVAFDDPQVYQAAKNNWQALLNDGVLQQYSTARYYIYAMEDQFGKQYGLVALVSVLDYENGVIRKHELTRPDKENDRVRHIQAVNAQVSPVLLAVKDSGAIAEQLKSCAQGEPLLSEALNGVQHTLWAVDSTLDQERIQCLFAQQSLLYVADGHHRTAAALRAHKASPQEIPPYCFAVIFPSQHMKILGYHRTVKDLNGHTPAAFLNALAAHYEIEKIENLCFPPMHGVCHMILGNQAYALTRQDKTETDSILSLDVCALSRFVLDPILGIADIRTDPRIGFVGGLSAVEDIQKQMKQGQIAVGFLMYPTQTDELLAVADADQLMPPKSTWFEPKLADGLISYSFMRD